MSRIDFPRRALSMTLVLGLAGCQPASPPPAAPPTPVAPAVKQTKSDDVPLAVVKKVVEANSEPDAPPVVAAKRLLQEIDAGKLDAFADFLPESYRKDLESAVQALAAKVPDELWQRWQSLAVKTTSLIQRKLDLITGSGDLPPDDENRARLAAALERLANTKTWDRQSWQTAELADMLKGPASDVLTVWQAVSPQSASLSAATDIQLIRLDGDKAILSFQSPFDPEPREVEFVKVDERWIPKSLAESWKAAITPWRQQIEKLTDSELAEAAAKIGPQLALIEGTLDEMLKAEHSDELQLGWWQIQSVLLQARQELLQSGPAPRVEVRFAGKITEDELSRLLDRLVEACDQPALAEYVTFPTASGTTIHLSPVNDVKAFVGKLTFVKVISSTERQVEIELPQ